MDHQKLIDYKKLEIRRLSKADDDVIALLKDTVLGSEGGMRYSMQNTPERIATYGDGLSFLALYKRNSLKGVIGLCRRVISNAGVRCDATYLRYLSVQSAFQTERAPGRRRGRLSGEGDRESGAGERLSGASDRMSGAGESFKGRILDLIREPEKYEGYNTSSGHGDAGAVKAAGSVNDAGEMANAGVEEPAGRPHVKYAYVESRNERSRNMINQSGYEYIRSFLTVAFSRFSPETNSAVSRLTPEEEPAMAALLDEQYRDYCFYTDEFSFLDHRYYVLRRNGEIVAGVGAIPAQYRVVNVPGLWGWLMMKALPRTPLFRRLFQPEAFRYVILNAIYCRKGSEDLLPDLFEAVCAEEGYHTALTWLDDHSRLFEMLRTNRRMGALNRMLNAKPGLVYALFSGFTPAEMEKFYDSPAYISGFDFS